MKRIGILTAGGDTPALNATLHGAVSRANQLKIEVIGLTRGFESLFTSDVPHVRLNPLFSEIPELDPTVGGTIIGSSRRYVNADDRRALDMIAQRLSELGIEGLICVGGDGTMNGLQALCEYLPAVLTPKTIDNDLGLNYPGEANHWARRDNPNNSDGYDYCRSEADLQWQSDTLQLDQMVNYATPGFATAVFVAVSGVMRVRTTAESHRRVAIIEVMGRHSGYIALGCAYGQPDIILLPESPVNLERLITRVKEIYDLQRNVVIICGEGIVGEDGRVLGASQTTTDPAGNVVLSGAAERLRRLLIEAIGDEYFSKNNRSAEAAIFTRKVGHTQRGGRPVSFDRFHAAQLGAKAIEMLVEGQNNCVATLQWNTDNGFHVDCHGGNLFRDQWGIIHARNVHPSFYSPERMHISPQGIEYLLPIFTNAIGHDDVEYIRQSHFDSGNLTQAYHSTNIDMQKRIMRL